MNLAWFYRDFSIKIFLRLSYQQLFELQYFAKTENKLLEKEEHSTYNIFAKAIGIFMHMNLSVFLNLNIIQY